MPAGTHLSLAQLWLIHCVVTAVRVTVRNPSVQVVRGGSALLPCAFRTTAALNRLNIIWTVSPLQEPQQPQQIISYEQGQIVEGLSDFLGRVGFAFLPTKDASIFINQTRSSDTGTYQCTVMNPPDGATPNIGIIGLTVLVPVSDPQCSSEGQGQEGGSLRLLCSVHEGIPVPGFRWEKIAPDGQILLIGQEGERRASASLHNISTQTSGLYRCTATNQLGSQSCTIALNVHVAVLGTMGIIAGITITLVMGLILLALFALVLCLHQQSQVKWREAADTCSHTRVENPSPGRTPCSDSAPSHRITRSLWTLESQRGNPSSHTLYDAQRCEESLTPVLETLNFRNITPSGSEQDDSSECGEDDMWRSHRTQQD